MAGTELDLTPTERRMYEMLQDGERHTKEELRTCLYDHYSSAEGVRVHICTLRAKLPEGKLIVCEIRHRIAHYRLVYKFNRDFVINPSV